MCAAITRCAAPQRAPRVDRAESTGGLRGAKAPIAAAPREPAPPAAVLGLPTIQPRLGEPLAGLTPYQLARFEAGREAFSRVLRPEHGLGPVHNLVSCRVCHSNPTGGSGTISVTMFGMNTDDGGFDPLTDLGGPLLQGEYIDDSCAERIPREANVIAERITSSTLGAGLIEAIPDEAIRTIADNQPPGLRGRVHWVRPLEAPADSALRPGRFGWKSQIATVYSFSAVAAHHELGITSRLLPEEVPPGGDAGLALECDRVPDPEAYPDAEGLDYIDRVTDFQRLLAPPPQTPRSGMEGEAVFHKIGCADCHVPEFTTADDPSLEPALRARTIRPYSDFLLHDMGALGDGIAQGDAAGHELRTPPLWGFRIRFPVLHDGRIARSTLEGRAVGAILSHAGEAAPAVDKFRSISPAERARLISFLGSLGRVEFDDDGDNDVDLIDLRAFQGCLTGVAPRHYNPDNRCSISDVDQDGDVDLADFSIFQRAFTASHYGSTMAVP